MIREDPANLFARYSEKGFLMDKKEALKLLERYTDALKAKAEAEDGLSKIDSAYKLDESSFDVPFVKFLTPFLGVFLVIALAFRIAFAGSLNYKNEVPVTIGMFAGAAVIGFVIAKLVHLLTQKKARKNLNALRLVTLTAKEKKISEYKAAIGKADYKIAVAESAIPVACRGIEAARIAKNKLLSGKAETLEDATGGFNAADWEDAYTPTAKMFSMPDGNVFGGFAISEATRTVLPKDPESRFLNDENTVKDWRMVLVSLTNDCALGDCDYYKTLAKLETFVIDSNEDSILIKGLSLKELEKLLEK